MFAFRLSGVDSSNMLAVAVVAVVVVVAVV